MSGVLFMLVFAYVVLEVCILASQPAKLTKPEPPPRVDLQLIIVAEDQLDVANAAAVKVAGKRAAKTFSVPYVDEKTGKRYYAASWRMTKAQREAFDKAVSSGKKSGKVQMFHKGTSVKARELNLKPEEPKKTGK